MNGAIPCVIVHTILGICEFSIKIDPLKWSEDDRRYGICVLKYGTSAGSTVVRDRPGLSYASTGSHPYLSYLDNHHNYKYSKSRPTFHLNDFLLPFMYRWRTEVSRYLESRFPSTRLVDRISRELPSYSGTWNGKDEFLINLVEHSVPSLGHTSTLEQGLLYRFHLADTLNVKIGERRKALPARGSPFTRGI